MDAERASGSVARPSRANNEAPQIRPGTTREDVEAEVLRRVVPNLTRDPRTGRVPLATIERHVAAALQALQPRPNSPRVAPAHQSMPKELWCEVFSHLRRQDLVDVARTCSHLGGIAEECLYRRAKLEVAGFVPWSQAVMAPHRADAVRSLTISLDGLEGRAKSAGTVMRLAGALARLTDLRDLTLVGAGKLPKSCACDILEACKSTRLRKFRCDNDALVLASWSSLSKQAEVEEFRGLFHLTDDLPSEVQPSAFPCLQVLDSAMPFVRRVTKDSRITHLSIRVPRLTAVQELERVSVVLGDQLVALRVIRTIFAPRTVGNDWEYNPPFADGRLWRFDSPVILCRALRAPLLQFFELRDVTPTKMRWSTDFETLRDEPGFQESFRVEQRTERIPALTTLFWRPIWADAAQLFKPIGLDHVVDIFKLLPVRSLALPLMENVARNDHGEGWSLFRRVADGQPSGGEPEGWDEEDGLLRGDGYADLEEQWAAW
ncbi:hypothetical protein OH77DRAFT_1524464 [Trametes cingulata]|nr:hypothetical protein OH77DRAFT_1524464 [Trametes cingulata]